MYFLVYRVDVITSKEPASCGAAGRERGFFRASIYRYYLEISSFAIYTKIKMSQKWKN